MNIFIFYECCLIIDDDERSCTTIFVYTRVPSRVTEILVEVRPTQYSKKRC